ncbi:SCO2322 family protein [Streptomyces sp. NPDC056411]|uniref:SCO2322 family protein n=1 Tax=Streptomyces sp. NPDC056411 TaxID=3345813 RepID=UPI0035DE8E03
MRSAPRRCRLSGALLVAGAVVGLATAGPAQAQEYRYWAFWDGAAGGSWKYATQGPATVRPDDGAVAGFRFTVSADSAAAGKPRAAADFADICRATPAKEGRKRIGIVIDFGTARDAAGGERPPEVRTECAQVSEDASAGDALAAVARPLRYDSNALLCAIAGYPKSGCAEQVKDSGGAEGSGASRAAGRPGGSAGADSSAGDDGGPSAGLLGGAAVVAVLGAAAVWQARRRRG